MVIQNGIHIMYREQFEPSYRIKIYASLTQKLQVKR